MAQAFQWYLKYFNIHERYTVRILPNLVTNDMAISTIQMQCLACLNMIHPIEIYAPSHYYVPILVSRHEKCNQAGGLCCCLIISG